MTAKLTFVPYSLFCFFLFTSFAFAESFSVSLSSKTTKPGNLERVLLEVPENLSPDQVKGSFGRLKLNFYEVEALEAPHDAQTSNKPVKKVLNALLPIPYHQPLGAAKVIVRIGKEKTVTSFKIVKKNYGSEVLKVNPRHVSPPKKALARILKEQAMVKKMYENFTAKKYWQGPFVLPIESAITSPFGRRRVFNGQLKNFHPGLDLRAAVGTPLYAASAGKVILAQDLYYTGNTVIIDHGYQVITLYAHMSELQVKEGQEIEAKQLLGNSGATGRVNGPHLHWQAVIQGVKINPLDLLKII